MVVSIKAGGNLINAMERDELFGIMELSMKDKTRIIKLVALDSWCGLMVRVILENSVKIKRMVGESTNTQKVITMKESGRMMKSMDMELSILREKESFVMESGSKMNL